MKMGDHSLLINTSFYKKEFTETCKTLIAEEGRCTKAYCLWCPFYCEHSKNGKGCSDNNFAYSKIMYRKDPKLVENARIWLTNNP